MVDILFFFFFFAVSVSETLPYVSYVLYGTVPALLLLLIAAAGFFCYKHHAKRYEQRCYTGRPLDAEDAFILQRSVGLFRLPQEEDTDQLQQIQASAGGRSLTVRRTRTLRL